MIWSMHRSIASLVTLLLFGCAHSFERGENLLINGSFEEGKPPWFDFHETGNPYWAEFSITDDYVYHGVRGARLALDSKAFGTSVGISGAIQEIATERFPRWLSGHFRVQRWNRGTSKQYVQLVVMALKPSNFAEFREISIQTAIILAGVEQPPLDMGNRRFRITGPVEPQLHEWIPFEIDLHELFEELWSGVPEGFEKIRFFIEVRFDQFDPQADERVIALVYFDDLYLGE